MVVILEQADDLENLIGWLQKQEPLATKVLYHVTSKKKKLVDCTVIVNKWPEPTAVFIKPASITKLVLGNGHSIYATSEEACRALFAGDGVIEWDKPMILGGTDGRYASLIEEEAKRHGCYIEFKVDCHMLVYKGNNNSSRSLPPGFEYITLNFLHAEKVLGSWKHVRIENLAYVEYLTKNYPSIGVVESISGELVAWSLVQHYGSSGMTHVMPEYRGKGLASCLTQKLADDLTSQGHQRVFVYCEDDNDTSIEMHKKCGYELWPEKVVWMKTQPEKE